MENALIDGIIRLGALDVFQGFGEVVIQDDGFVAEFADQEVLLLDFLLEGCCSFEVLLQCVELGVIRMGRVFGSLELFPELFKLGLGVFDHLSELLLTC